MKTLTVLLTLISMTALVQGHAAAQAIDRSLVCENVSFTVNNVGKRAILVVDVRYRPIPDGAWREFRNTKNRVLEPGESIEWRRSVRGIESHDMARAKIRYKKRVRDRWVPVRREVCTTVDAMCFNHDTYFIFHVG